MTNNKVGLKLSAVAISILLASCGGGGSDGYFENNNTGGGSTTPTTPEALKTSSLKIELSKLSLAASNDTLNVTVRALDANKGGVVGTNVDLAIIDSTGNVTIQGKSSVTTDENGNAIFVITTPTTSTTLKELIEKGFSIKATANNGSVVQEQTITVTGNQEAGADTTSIVLFDATKTALNVRGDQTTLTLTAVDSNGAVLPNQAISLKVVDAAKNGVKFVPQAVQTDANGQISYTLVLSENARNANYTAESFVKDDLNLEANFGQSTTIYKYRIDVLNSSVPKPVGAITVAANPTTIQDSANGVYYYKNISVQVNDIDGKPLAGQDVIMGVNALMYVKGNYIFQKNDKDEVKYVYAPSAGCTTPTVKVNINGNAVDQLKPVNNQTVQVVSFIKGEGLPATDNKYTTDSNGRFDLQIQYPKIFASWLHVQLTATTNIATSKINGTTSIGLSYLGSDVDYEAENGPNMNSPFGQSSNCNDGR